ncbi:MAG: hypothetical protein KKD07_09880 [Candidatus Omnitrophica bacterium]|nr:hypothetical protein [Candidatus Omnitrophota bacterium]MBU4334736.1 hypothetical protein [Candidatus Omnitrophota bacterium]
MRKDMMEKICLILLFLSVSFNITYWAMAKYDVGSDFSAVSDAKYYIKMSQSDYEGVPYRYAQRIFMPSIVGFVNNNLDLSKILPEDYEGLEKKKIQLSFGIVNIFCIAGTALFFFYFCQELGFSKWESLVGCFLFFTSFFVVTYYTVPLIDSMACFFVMACFYMILKNRLFWLSICFLFGIMTKEAVFVVLLIIGLNDRTVFTKKLLVCVPGILIYIIFSKIGFVSSGHNIFGILMDLTLLKETIIMGISSIRLYTVIETVQTFMFLWILFLYALFKIDKPVFIKKQVLLMILPFIVPFLVRVSVVGRIAFYLFPIVIPLALLVLREIFCFAEKIELKGNDGT